MGLEAVMVAVVATVARGVVAAGTAKAVAVGVRTAEEESKAT